jgi:hypothetical protein
MKTCSCSVILIEEDILKRGEIDPHRGLPSSGSYPVLYLIDIRH